MPVSSSRGAATSKRATNITVSKSVLADAKELQINLSKAAERGIAQAIAEKRTELWLIENKHALDSSNEYVEKYGLPLARFRQF